MGAAGHRAPANTLLQLAAILGTTIGYLLGEAAPIMQDEAVWAPAEDAHTQSLADPTVVARLDIDPVGSWRMARTVKRSWRRVR